MSRFLDAFSQFLSGRGHRIHRIAEYCEGGTIEQIQLSPATPCQNIYSIAKVFTGAAVGLLVDRGMLATDDKVVKSLGSFCPENYNPRWEETTVDMLLRHHVGLPGGFMDIDCTDANAFGEDYLSYVMNHPLRDDHGTQFSYTDASHYILSCIVESRIGMPLDDFLWRELFRPLGFRDAAWSHCPKGHVIGSTGLHLRVEDVVKMGAVYLQGGVWNGRRIFSEEWVKTVMERQYEFSPYGSEEIVSKAGMLGQNLVIMPKQHRVVAWQAATGLGQEDIKVFLREYTEDN